MLPPTPTFPDSQDPPKRPLSKDPSTWSVDDVIWFIKEADAQALGPHIDVFRKHVCFLQTYMTCHTTKDKTSQHNTVQSACPHEIQMSL